jgi:hypothetical protein
MYRTIIDTGPWETKRHRPIEIGLKGQDHKSLFKTAFGAIA